MLRFNLFQDVMVFLDVYDLFGPHQFTLILLELRTLHLLHVIQLSGDLKILISECLIFWVHINLKRN